MALADSKFDDICLQCFNLNNKKVNALIAGELSGFTCTRSLTINSKFFNTALGGIQLVQVNPDNSLAECVNLFIPWARVGYEMVNRELKQPRRRRQQKPHIFAYLTMKNSIFARFARAFFIFWHFVDVLVLSTTWSDLFRSCVDIVSIWWQMFNFVFLCPKRWFQFNSRIVRTVFKHNEFE